MSRASRWLQDPLVLFLILGSAVLFIYLVTRQDTDPQQPSDRIMVTAADVDRLRNQWLKTWQRPPTDRELRGLVENEVRQEILYREAMKLGLDRDDQVIRRRLVTKLEYLAKDLGGFVEPTEDEFRAFFAENQEKYIEPARRRFSQVYFNEDSRGPQAETDARALLENLRTVKNPWELAARSGDTSLLQPDYLMSSHREIAQQLGSVFADTLFTLQVGSWQGPIRSSYGLHLVWIQEEALATLPSLVEVRDRVRVDLVQQRRQQFLEGYLDRVRGNYQVEYALEAQPPGEAAP